MDDSLGAMAIPRTLKGRAKSVVARLVEEYPGTAQELCALDHHGPYELLVATVLSAQCTDRRVNAVTPALFAAFPSAEALATASLAELEAAVRPTGFFRTKAAHCASIARMITEYHDGVVPSSLEELTALPGVGRKTANVVRSVAFDLPGLPVDTHVGRLARRLALTTASVARGRSGQSVRAIPETACATTATATMRSPASQAASCMAPIVPTPAAKAIRAMAEGRLKPSQAATPPASPARSMPRLTATWLLAGPGRNWQSATRSA